MIRVINNIIDPGEFDLEGFVQFAADELEVSPDVTLRVYHDRKLLDRFSLGGYEYQALLYQTALPGHYNLVVREGIGAGLQDVLSHEMVHLSQYTTGRLWLNLNTGAVMWEGKIYSSTVPYEERPWEKEAFDRQRRLLKAWKKRNNKKHCIIWHL